MLDSFECDIVAAGPKNELLFATAGKFLTRSFDSRHFPQIGRDNLPFIDLRRVCAGQLHNGPPHRHHHSPAT